MVIVMKALNLYGAHDIRLENMPEPEIQKDTDIKIKVTAVGICGSDIHRYDQLGPYVKGMTWGHEFAGEIAACGAAVKKYKVGQKVTACPALYCGECEACRKGKFAQCEKLSVIGAYCPGAFAQYIVMPQENVVLVPHTISDKEAALVEPACVALHGIYNAGGISAGDTVAVLGCGTVGGMALQWAKINGARRIIAIDIDNRRLAAAKELGADEVINVRQEIDIVSVLSELTAGRGVDIAIEAAGTPETSAQVLALPKKGGKVIYMGIPYHDVMIKRFYFEKIVRSELAIFGTWNAISGPFPGKEWSTCVDFLAKNILQTKPLIAVDLPLEQGPVAFEKAVKGEFAGKVIFTPWEKE